MLFTGAAPLNEILLLLNAVFQLTQPIVGTHNVCLLNKRTCKIIILEAL